MYKVNRYVYVVPGASYEVGAAVRREAQQFLQVMLERYPQYSNQKDGNSGTNSVLDQSTVGSLPHGQETRVPIVDSVMWTHELLAGFEGHAKKSEKQKEIPTRKQEGILKPTKGRPPKQQKEAIRKNQTHALRSEPHVEPDAHNSVANESYRTASESFRTDIDGESKNQARSPSWKMAASKTCHICQRKESRATLVPCGNIRLYKSRCTKAICVQCFSRFELGVAEDALRRNRNVLNTAYRASNAFESIVDSFWICTHCRKECPASATCEYRRRRILKQSSET
uniref:Uncharacterized protein n=1 Tax=Timspurckia oligopyrenoides TaxID=708627 RepID=A0A7S0ZE33_9RHOD|mmetsp:Transcript_1709/g.3019  ORF Transcript_1709/g.3019 Transcript_1709/m.3019 type:complete len:283 (+) Transcript_1709:143-991(+)